MSLGSERLSVQEPLLRYAAKAKPIFCNEAPWIRQGENGFVLYDTSNSSPSGDVGRQCRNFSKMLLGL